MTPISLKQFVLCKNNTDISFPQVNCVHWAVKETEKCNSYCTLKQKNVGLSICTTCSERKPIFDSKKNFGALPPQQQLKQLLPQVPYIAETVDNNDDSFTTKAKKYSTAEASQFIQGKVSEEVYEKRKTICMECPHKSNPKPDEESIGWCKKCGCGSKNTRAALSNKLWIPAVDCPLKKFGKEVGKGFNASDALDSVKGTIQSIGNLFMKETYEEEKQEKIDKQE